jgi:predicted AAA+ superfamily ATPase
MVNRSITNALLQALGDSPVVLLNGARQVGKSTLVKWLSGSEHPAHYLTLDDAAILSAIQLDPAGFLSGHDTPLIIDEVQRAPDLFRAIKQDVDKKRRSGQYLLTGSANVLLLPKISESLAGRMEILTLHPFAQSELEGAGSSLIDAAFAPRPPHFSPKSAGLADIMRRILTGGFPEVQQRTALERRNAWFGSYVTTILQRDIRDLANIEGLTVLPHLLSLLAARSGSLLNLAELSNSSGIPQTTLKRYLVLLETTFLIQRIPSWSGNLGKRLIKTPKLYLTDTGAMTYLVGADETRLKTDRSLLGKAMETFVLNELVKLNSWSKARARIYHYRTHLGNEVDFLLERSDGAIVAIEVKSSSTVDSSSFATMISLSHDLKKQFLLGIVLYTGKEVIHFGSNLVALPLESLWT